EDNTVILRTRTATYQCALTTNHPQPLSVPDRRSSDLVEALPSDITVECDNIPVAQTLTANDNCGSATVSVNDVVTAGSCANNYTIARTWTATDECRLTTIHTQTITIQDTNAPTYNKTLPSDIAV